MKRFAKHTLPAVMAVAALGALCFGTRNDFGLGRNMEILINMMRELAVYYVDEVDTDALAKGAAEGMMRSLDPYTEFLPEDEMANIELLTTGKYGGVGSLIRKRGDYVVFAQPYKGSPADRAGIIIGDKIVAIDGEDARGFDTEDVSKRLKGDPGSNVKVTVERLIGGGRETLTLRRERISIPSIPYAGWFEDGIAYIRHDDFTEDSYREMRAAIERLQAEGPIRGIVLDYRNNGGGIMQEAVRVLSLFLPKGTEVLTTRGRTAPNVSRYRTELEPLVADTVPMAVLINGNTASSSEIVAGALQDLDRAVVVGQRSFGKGLVQSIRPVGYNSMVKLTTAKYYTPSGRCVQAVDYSGHLADGTARAVPDSLTHEFRTAAGRIVRDGGGITPDVKTDPEYICRFAMTLYALGHIDDFGDEYFREHHADSIDLRTFSITDADYERFREFMAGREVPYESDTRRALNALRRSAEADLFDEDLRPAIESIEAGLHDDLDANLETYRDEIVRTINNDIVLRHGYARGVAEHNLADDKEAARAAGLLRDRAAYDALLAPPADAAAVAAEK
ncbi:MAG: S41 family peptidase [Alistipes sp.]|nr:S41 family peptidase [Alistipes sp.]